MDYVEKGEKWTHLIVNNVQLHIVIVFQQASRFPSYAPILGFRIQMDELVPQKQEWIARSMHVEFLAEFVEKFVDSVCGKVEIVRRLGATVARQNGGLPYYIEYLIFL